MVRNVEKRCLFCNKLEIKKNLPNGNQMFLEIFHISEIRYLKIYVTLKFKRFPIVLKSSPEENI